MIGGKRYLAPNGNLAIWFAFLGAPVVWFTAMVFVYFNVARACVVGSSLSLYIIDGAALAIILLAGFIGYSIWVDTGEELPGEHGTRTDRSRLMAVVGIMMSSLFGVVVAGHIVAMMIVGPCIPLPRVRFTPDAVVETQQPLFAQESSL